MCDEDFVGRCFECGIYIHVDSNYFYSPYSDHFYCRECYYKLGFNYAIGELPND